MSDNYVPRIGDIGVVRTGGYAARLIQIGTLSRWNHAFIYIGYGNIVEATPRGVKFGKADQYQNIVWNKHQIISDEDRAFISIEALDNSWHLEPTFFPSCRPRLPIKI